METKYSEEDKDSFFEAVESLKKYRRADLIDETGRSLLEDLYTDLLPNDHILKKCLKDNTTFLIGRKGTGKSTIFLRMEQEIRTKKNYLSCYIDVKTVYESSQAQSVDVDYISDILQGETLTKYLIERTFIQNVLVEIKKEIAKKTTETILNKLAKLFTKPKEEIVQSNLSSLKRKIENNEYLKDIEIPVLQKVVTSDKVTKETSKEKDAKLGNFDLQAELKPDGIGTSFKTDSGIEFKKGSRNASEIESQFSNIFLQVFQIKEIIIEIKEILRILEIKHLVILLDDLSEIDDTAIKTFVDVILSPLNNWSEDFIKFKVAVYPNRYHYGKIDPGKVDTINLDFYNLYSEFDRDKMEISAFDFTKRLVEKRIIYYTKKSPEYFFDCSKNEIMEYYELLFQVSMNVPRIIGYILSYCHQNKIIFDKPIIKQDIEAAAQKYYEEKIEPFFYTTTYSLLSIDEKIPTLQLKELIKLIIEKLSDIKKRISTQELKGSLYLPTFPYSSHFYFDPRLEEFIKTLELNFFISKYSEMTDRDRIPSSIYCINYGLSKKNNLLWGKPKGNQYRKYFIERPFNFNKIISEFLTQSKRIHCINPSCNRNYTIEELPYLKSNKNKCFVCSNPVIIESISDDIKAELSKIDQEKLLPIEEMKIIFELSKSNESKFARGIAEELDYSSQLVARRAKILDEKEHLIERNKDLKSGLYKYKLTIKAIKNYIEK